MVMKHNPQPNMYEFLIIFYSKMNYFLNFKFSFVHNPTFKVEEAKDYEIDFSTPETSWGCRE